VGEFLGFGISPGPETNSLDRFIGSVFLWLLGRSMIAVEIDMFNAISSLEVTSFQTQQLVERKTVY
jgi:hypothetical protein